MKTKIQLKDIEKMNVGEISRKMGNPLEREISKSYICKIYLREGFIYHQPDIAEIDAEIHKQVGHALDDEMLMRNFGTELERLKEVSNVATFTYIFGKHKVPLTLDILLKDLVESISNAIRIPEGKCLKGVNLLEKQGGIFLSSPKGIYLTANEHIVGFDRSRYFFQSYTLENPLAEKLNSKKLLSAYLINLQKITEKQRK